MKKILTIAAAAVISFGCSPEDTEPTFTITETNVANVVEASLTAAGDSAEYGSSKIIENSAGPRTMITRLTQTLPEFCSSGSGSTTVEMDDSLIISEEIATSGSVTASSTFSDCATAEATVDGKLDFSLSWAGITNLGNFSNITIEMDFIDFSVTTSEGKTIVDGNMTSIATETEYSLAFDYFLTSYEINNETLRTRTTSPIVSGMYDDYPSTGSWRIEGADDTYAEATIISNGIEVSVNGAQATVYTWAELEIE